MREPRGGADERARGRYPVASVRPLVLLRVRQAGSRAVGHLTVAALYVEAGGVYYGLPDVDPWDEARDARRYPGPWPVVAHPPCNRWSIMVESNPQIRDLLGQDGGTFAAALDAVRTYGGVLEHPALTRAWAAHNLPRPSSGGWATTFTDPGYATEVDQGRYGHPARKLTWLYCAGIDPPALRWGDGGKRERNTRNMGSGGARSRTPLAFRDALLDMARSALTVSTGP